MTLTGIPVALAAMALSLFTPAIATVQEKTPETNQQVLLPALSSPETIARQLGGDGTAFENAVSANLSKPMPLAPSHRHSAMIFLTAVGAGALLGALIDGSDGAGKGVLLGAAVGAGYLIAVNF